MSNNKQYIIVDIINKEFFKTANGETKIFSSREDAELHCAIYELENAWVCQLITNYIEPEGVKKMKLYTKEEFLKAAEFCEVSMIDARYILERIDEVTDPIELPSDEEIEETAKDKVNLSADCFGQYDFTSGKQDGFIDGAIWMRNKIQGGNK